MWARGGISAAIAAIVITHGAIGHACGASAGGGGVAVCNVDEMREKERKKWHVAALYSFSDTALKFSGPTLAGVETFEQTRHAALAVGEWRATPRWNFQVGAGGLLGGTFYHPELLGAGGRDSIDPGFVGVVGTSFLALENDHAIPFVLLSAQFSSIIASTAPEVGYRAFDLRVGASVGWTLYRVLSPYAVLRVFGGPATWEIFGESITGTDKYHYQVGAGVSWLIARRIDVFAEGIAFGERGLSVGAGVTF